jgi:hypothetical protein
MEQPERRKPYLEEMGWHRSAKERKSIDAQGEPVPWYTYPAMAFIAPRVKPSWQVFEYGSGYSTLWWSKRVATLVSCEHNQAWFDKVSQEIPTNVTYVRRDLPDYAGEVLKYEPFNVVVVDGEERLASGENAVKRLTDDGVIIWDNSEIARYQKWFDGYYKDLGFRKIDFVGMGPQIDRRWGTTILYRPGNCFGI